MSQNVCTGHVLPLFSPVSAVRCRRAPLRYVAVHGAPRVLFFSAECGTRVWFWCCRVTRKCSRSATTSARPQRSLTGRGFGTSRSADAETSRGLLGGLTVFPQGRYDSLFFFLFWSIVYVLFFCWALSCGEALLSLLNADDVQFANVLLRVVLSVATPAFHIFDSRWRVRPETGA